jgi:hypothetical protein
MLKRALWIILAGVFAATIYPVSGQTTSKPTAEVTSARVTRTVSLRVNVIAAERQLLVPYCAEGEGGTETLCNLSIHVEIETREGWHPMKPRLRKVVLGGVPPDNWKFQLIPAGRGRDFFFAFTKDDFAVEHGQRLRASWMLGPTSSRCERTSSRFK